MILMKNFNLNEILQQKHNKRRSDFVMNSLTVVDSQQSAAEMSHYILLLLCFIILPITGFQFDSGALKNMAYGILSFLLFPVRTD